MGSSDWTCGDLPIFREQLFELFLHFSEITLLNKNMVNTLESRLVTNNLEGLPYLFGDWERDSLELDLERDPWELISTIY